MLTEIYLGNTFQFCYCGVDTRILEMRTTPDLAEVSGYSVMVISIDLREIGVADSKAEYIALWNLDTVNVAAGYLTGADGPFKFKFIRTGGLIPPFVFGNPVIHGDFNNDFSDDFFNI